jgi:hypothetical protein
MRNAILITLVVLSISGCANISPRNKQNINNEKGEIGDIRNNQQGFMLELGKMKQDVQMIGSKLKEVQEGLVNLNACVSRNDNTGVQILQGDGSLFLVFSCAVLAFIFYYKNRKNEETLKTLTNKIVEINDENLTNSIIDGIVEKDQAKKILKMLKS